MAGPGNNPFGGGSSDKDVSRIGDANSNHAGDARTSPYTNKNGADSLNIIRTQENQNSYPEYGTGKTRELSPQASLQDELNKLMPPGDHHKYTVTLSHKNGGPYFEIKGGDTQSNQDFLDNVGTHCSESFWKNINKLTANNQKVSFSVGGQESPEHPTMQKMEPKLDTANRPADAAKAKDNDAQIIDSKLKDLIPEGVHLKFSEKNGRINYAPDKYVDPQHWSAIEQAFAKNPDLLNAVHHKMGSSGHLEIASSHQPAAKADSSQPDSDGRFKFNASHTDLNASAQRHAGGASESLEPMYLGGHVLVNGIDVRLDPRVNKTIPANAGDGFPIDAKAMPGTSGISNMQGYLHTEGNAKYFRVQRIVYANGQSDSGQNLADIPLTKQNKDGIASY